ncbi:MAG TPA: hypothetical protein ENF73_00900 [Proteobacteria bacterium]|nr:hypothetical protein [Pseudomonadota bacterium]
MLAQGGKTAIKVAAVNLFLYALLWPVSFFLADVHVKIILVSSFLVLFTLLSFVSPGAGIAATFLAFLFIQLPAIVLGSEPFLWMFYLVFTLGCIVAISRARDNKGAFKAAGLLFLIWFFTINVYYRFPCRLWFSPETAIIGVLTFLVLGVSLKWFGTSESIRVLISVACLTLLFVWTSTLCLVASVPSPLQSIIADRQRGVTTLLPAWKMPGGARVFAPTDEGWLVGVVNHYNEKERTYQIYLLDKDGKPVKPPLPTVSRLNEINNLEGSPNMWLIPGLNRATLCVLDVDNWRSVIQTELSYNHTRLALSPSGDFVATYAEQSPYISVFHTKDLELMSLTPHITDNCRWIGLGFIDDSHILGYCRMRSAVYFMGTPCLYELELKEQRMEVLAKIAMPRTVEIEGIDSVNDKMILLDSSFGRMYVYDAGAKRIVRQKNLYIPTLRYLKKIDSCELLCAAGELGLVVLLDYDLNVRKVLFGGSKIKSVYVKGKRVYLASQAGLIEIDIEKALAD